MKYIAKMMLALLASVTMVAQVYAWDFKVTGSAEATFNQATSKSNDNASAITTQNVGSSEVTAFPAKASAILAAKDCTP